MAKITTGENVTVRPNDFWVVNAAAALNEQFTGQQSVSGNLVLGVGDVVANYSEYTFVSGDLTYRYIGNWEVSINGGLLTATTSAQGYYDQVIVERHGEFYAGLDLDAPLSVDFGSESGIDLLGLGLSGLTNPLLAAVLGGEPTTSLDNLHLAVDPDLPEEAGIDPSVTIVNGSASGDDMTGTAGSDLIHGQAGNDVIFGLAGNDTIFGDAGNDTLNGGAGQDKLDGGTGIDTLDYAGSNAGVTIDLQLGTASGGHAQGDQIFNFENVNGSSHDDKFLGDGRANIAKGLDGNDGLNGRVGDDRLYGNDGNDTLIGELGADVLVGGNGIDVLAGGAGRDYLWGGADADRFAFKRVTDSTVESAGRDTIEDFSVSQGDKIDLSVIDARASFAGDQDFNFIGGSSFHKVEGELRYQVNGTETFVYGDVNGDGKADFGIHLDGAISLTGDNFLL
ncbi:hypothetical protein IFT66_22835 [Rhizobium sp. CFBP 13726]|uniref:calcium-binding protein n=1 Tax=Rhizobium sp. CFBP 13726 TaxID=2775296 RepID=UPI00177D6090|nr:hypothetical protein [Rhizobium sp. CFBP 13726]MBD8653929.1 hypothetical protein [Rhizobium sp. CFBP 13726]